MTPTESPRGDTGAGDEYYRQTVQEITERCAKLLWTLARLESEIQRREQLASVETREPRETTGLISPGLLRALRAQLGAELRECQTELDGVNAARQN